VTTRERTLAHFAGASDGTALASMRELLDRQAAD